MNDDSHRLFLEYFQKPLQDSGLQFTLRVNDPLTWQIVWQELSYQPVAYSEAMIAYQHAYLLAPNKKIGDISMVLFSGGKACGIWPLTLALSNDAEIPPIISSCGGAVFAPVFSSHTGAKTKQKVCNKALKFLQLFQTSHKSTAFKTQQMQFPAEVGNGAEFWHHLAMNEGQKPNLKHFLYANLQPNEEIIRSNFRKSYKPLINMAMRQWESHIYDKGNIQKKIWQEFKNLHLKMAGRKTRCEESWDLQYEMIASGEAFLVALRTKDEKRFVGAGFFQTTRDEGLYSVGVYDRSLFAQPLGHGVQNRAIEVMKNSGMKWYLIGQRFYSGDNPTPDEKELSISLFKQGFSSHIFFGTEFDFPATPTRG